MTIAHQRLDVSFDEMPEQIKQAFSHVYSDDFANAMMGVNHLLSVEVRGWHEKAGWGMGIILTPWMLAKIYLPLTDASVTQLIPEDWQATARQKQSYVVIGPLQPLIIDGQTHTTHLNYHPELGHYWLQPLVQNMARYSDNESAFAAWGEVLAFRKAYRDKLAAEAEVEKQKAAEVDTRKRALLDKFIKA